MKMNNNEKMAGAVYTAGIDVGSTTTKIVILDQENNLLFSDYARHHASQEASVIRALQMAAEALPGCRLRIAMTGSGAKPIADALGVPFVQEVVANAIALKKEFPNVRTAIELGGQDAKMIFFRRDTNTGELIVSDMRMNGSCAGGTGAFIDEIAQVLKTPIEEFNALAAQGTTVYDISGRCGVYAKTDIQPLLNQGVARTDLALSSFHAIAKQTIGGLAQGLEIHKPVVFEGGPLTFNPRLVEVFAERLHLTKSETLRPAKPELIIAMGAAFSLDVLFRDDQSSNAQTPANTYESPINDSSSEAVERANTNPPEHWIGILTEHLRTRGSSSDAINISGWNGRRFFENEEERQAFLTRHALPELRPYEPKAGDCVRAYLGIDSGSTTTKFVLIDENKNLLDSFYSNNEGDPLAVATRALKDLRDRWRKAGAELVIEGCGSTGYGELLFHRAMSTECHVVETVAHARAAEEYASDPTFILDIGGQDMKAIWLKNGIITNIVVNEACSSGCGSFLANFAKSLNIPVQNIAEEAFSSENPAALGSRCTVFMNSSIITEQRNGKNSGDICAGLCRSIIENLFTKVIRVSNLASLGDRIVVQGGTFRNDAVLRAMEQYLGRKVTRAPYPGLMGAIGAALLTKERVESGQTAPSFIGLDALDDFHYEQESGDICPFCTNHCRRTILRFSNGNSWVTGNRCERGEILGDPKDTSVKEKLAAAAAAKAKIPNLFALRQKLLFQDYQAPKLAESRGITIGLPRVLAFWDDMPFWKTFWQSLGYDVKISPFSTRKMYENGLSAVASDTVCFPAKLVHGHIRELANMGVDRIFLPTITTVSSENTEATSESMCAVVKGYPIVIRNSDNPNERFGIPYDAPLFHWHTPADRDRQLTRYMKDTFGIDPAMTRKAMQAGDHAENEFHRQMFEAGERIMKDVRERGTFAVVLASRPYQNDPLVNHDLPAMFTELGIPVLTADSIEDARHVDLHNSRLDIVNNFHARMLSTAILAAQREELEYVQVVSFGCGHDAYLSDEILRMMGELSEKPPLILKMDESDIQGPLRIRVRSFIETVHMRRSKTAAPSAAQELKDPYPVKFTKQDTEERVVLVPNTSHAFARVMSAALRSQHIKAEPLALGREEAIRLGKQYVHNDICFPAQIVIGEALAALRTGKYDPEKTAIGMGKYIGDCRLTHYSALLRKALDDAGFSQVPILTNDDVDYHNMHPGFKMNLASALRIAFGLPMIDALEELLRKIRPYELEEGAANAAFEKGLDAVVEGLEKGTPRAMRRGLRKAIDLMNGVAYDRSNPRPTVLIVGEYLLNFHPGANHDIEDYLEQNGFEIIEARMTDVIRKTYFYQDAQVREYHVKKPLKERAWLRTANKAFDLAHSFTDSIACKNPLYAPATRMDDLVKASDPIIHHTFDAGEGVLIPGEILHHAAHGCRNFVILQPFGCLPNHVVGRGIARRLKELYPNAQILPLDYDPDVSFANIENRLQMLIVGERAAQN